VPWLKERHGPLTGTAWLITGGAVLAAYVLFRRYEADRAGSAASALGAGTTGVPAASGVQGATPGFANLSDWEAAAVEQMAGLPGLDAGQALNTITNWISGNCVSQAGYNGLVNIFTSIGLPPGMSGANLAVLSVCPQPTTTTGTTTTSTGTTTAGLGPRAAPPNLPAGLIQAMQSTGEFLVDEQWDPTLNEWIYLSNRGGVFALNSQGTTAGTTFYGSIQSLPDNFANWMSGGQWVRTASKLTINPDGTYTVSDTAGEQYTFTPTTLKS
jgi:hypothetical protein